MLAAGCWLLAAGCSMLLGSMAAVAMLLLQLGWIRILATELCVSGWLLLYQNVSETVGRDVAVVAAYRGERWP